MKTNYDTYLEIMRKKADIEYAIGVLNWDKEVYLPTKGARFRAQQTATLEGIAHEIFTNEAFGDLVTQLHENSNGLEGRQQKNIALTLKEYRRQEKLDKAFVMRRSQAISTAYHTWLKAREANDYDIYKKALDDLLQIKREEAERVGYEKHPYDALLDEYEADTTTAQLDILFKDVREQLVDFVQHLRQKPQVNNDFLFQFYPKDKQWDFGLELLKNMGYDFEAGRQDIAPHPFTINFSPEDVRVTTRVDEHDFANMLWSTIHEGGHALYEQGLPSSEYGLPLGTYLTVGIHESQSRLWENQVARSLSYWKAHYPRLQQIFPEHFSKLSLSHFYQGINKVEPSLIRVESDELHYHFHIMIRYEIEKQLVEGSLSVDGLREVWNELYKNYLNLEVPDDNRGILQDVHWSHGIFGYFPTYSLGSFYAAQFFKQAQTDLPNLQNQMSRGELGELLQWLRVKVHQHGRFYTAKEMCENITGEPLNFKYFMEYAREKFEGIYVD